MDIFLASGIRVVYWGNFTEAQIILILLKKIITSISTLNFKTTCTTFKTKNLHFFWENDPKMQFLSRKIVYNWLQILNTVHPSTVSFILPLSFNSFEE